MLSDELAAEMVRQGISHKRAMDMFSRAYVCQTLIEADGRADGAAKIAGKGRATINRLIRRLEIDRTAFFRVPERPKPAITRRASRMEVYVPGMGWVRCGG